MIERDIPRLVEFFQSEYNIQPEEINCGECNSFAEHLLNLGYGGDILSDAHFYDCFGDTAPDELLDPTIVNSPKPVNFDAVGMPAHYWLYYNGKHYDSECPNGVINLFDLPIMKRFYQ
jgi:hypothetical protein